MNNRDGEPQLMTEDARILISVSVIFLLNGLNIIGQTPCGARDGRALRSREVTRMQRRDTQRTVHGLASGGF
jgi:hypothetical protein